jgi:membrane associated rhomboid family serine protease
LSFFLHGGIFHLLSNLCFLLVFGDKVEDDLGSGRFLLLLTMATVVGDIVHIAADPDSTLPCIGASGGISGVIAYYALKFPRARLGFLFWIFHVFRWVRAPAVVLFVVWIGIQLLGTSNQLAGISNVSYLAHLGGAAVGFVFWLVFRAT